MVMGMRQVNEGYTLLELLVVLVIISIVAGMAVLTIGHNDNKELQAFTQSLAQSLTLAEEQALLQPTTLGLAFTPSSFRFYEHRQSRSQMAWEPLSGPEMGQHAIPADIQVSLQIAQARAGLPPKGNTPSILISTNGSLTPFVILIGKKNKRPRYQVIGRADGSILSQVYKG